MTVGLLASYFSTGLARRGLTQTELSRNCYMYMNMCTELLRTNKRTLVRCRGDAAKGRGLTYFTLTDMHFTTNSSVQTA